MIKCQIWPDCFLVKSSNLLHCKYLETDQKNQLILSPVIDSYCDYFALNKKLKTKSAFCERRLLVKEYKSRRWGQNVEHYVAVSDRQQRKEYCKKMTFANWCHDDFPWKLVLKWISHFFVHAFVFCCRPAIAFSHSLI